MTETAEVNGQRIEYRLHRGRTSHAVVLLHGAHMSARTRFREQAFLPQGCSVLVPSRPGYGDTAVAAGPSVSQYTARLATLCRRLDLFSVTAVGLSMGSRSALTLAAQHPGLVERVVLLCPVSFSTWPDRRTRRAARILFHPASEWATWGLVHALLASRPDVILPTAVRGLTTLATTDMLRRMGGDLDELVVFLRGCRSGRGFLIDLKPAADVTADVTQPTLVVASRNDGSVGFEHAERLAATIPQAELAEIDAASHVLWLGDRALALSATVRSFLRR